MSAIFVFLLSIGVVWSWHGEQNWATIHDGKPSDRFDPVLFRRHPQKGGQLIQDAYAALYIDPRKNPTFGEALVDENGQICANFNIDNSVVRKCSGYRILQNSRTSNPFVLIKPEKYDHMDYEAVEYLYYRLVLVWDPETDSSYFGNLHLSKGGEEPWLSAVDYNGAPVEVRGKQATSGDFTLYVVEQKFRKY